MDESEPLLPSSDDRILGSIQETYKSTLVFFGVSNLKLITKGVVTEVSFVAVPDRTYSNKYIIFYIDGSKNILDFDKTYNNSSGIDYEIYNKKSVMGIIPNTFYYIYDWDGMRTVWSQLPKKLGASGMLKDDDR